MTLAYSLALAPLHTRLANGSITPSELARDVLAFAAEGDRYRAWIYRLPDAAVLEQAKRLEASPTARKLPLYGIPFAVKDNIDAAGHPTTAACPSFSYTPTRNATVVQRLLDAGAILIGKTNLDQFATGLVGVRSPYGACRNPFDERYISGGSSSGSAVAVALNLVSFALGTDTAGSGRVPAGFNNVVGLKPTRGVLSASGVVPACRSLDCVSIFALTCDDARQVFNVARGYDQTDPYSRTGAPQPLPAGDPFRCGVPQASDLEFCGDREAENQYRHGLQLIERAGGMLVEFDFAPLREAAALLYQGPWLAERLAAIKDFYAAHAADMHPITREITAAGEKYSAVDAFEAQYRLHALKQQFRPTWETVDVLAVPTAPTIYTIEQVEADPLRLNSRLGYYTNFVNLFDLSAIAVPTGMRIDHVPSGVTLIAPHFSEELLCGLGARIQTLGNLALGATSFELPV